MVMSIQELAQEIVKAEENAKKLISKKDGRNVRIDRHSDTEFSADVNGRPENARISQ